MLVERPGFLYKTSVCLCDAHHLSACSTVAASKHFQQHGRILSYGMVGHELQPHTEP
jgi:hypothetical protein